MFGIRRKEVPDLLPSNAGRGSSGRTAFAKAGKTWFESFDLIELLASALRQQGREVRERKHALELADADFLLLPQMTYLQPLEPSGVRTATTIQFHHPFLVPAGSFEYQHATGENLQAAFRSGFDQWVQMDLVALLDSLCEKPNACTTLKFDFEPHAGKPGVSRRAVLGPYIHFSEVPVAASCDLSTQSKSAGDGVTCEGDGFCPCCLLTRSLEAFKRQIEDDKFFGLRLYAARNRDGIPMADCRVNGEDWEDGAVALRKYASSWSEAGFEFRKQYVVLQSFQ
jgi:hypothetical protein